MISRDRNYNRTCLANKSKYKLYQIMRREYQCIKWGIMENQILVADINSYLYLFVLYYHIYYLLNT